MCLVGGGRAVGEGGQVERVGREGRWEGEDGKGGGEGRGR